MRLLARLYSYFKLLDTSRLKDIPYFYIPEITIAPLKLQNNGGNPEIVCRDSPIDVNNFKYFLQSGQQISPYCGLLGTVLFYYRFFPTIGGWA
jgi:hypothetical protein